MEKKHRIFHTIRGRMLFSFVTVFLVVIALMGISIYIFTDQLLERRNQESYNKILNAADEILDDKMDLYSGLARMLLGDADVQRVLQMQDSSSGIFMDTARWNQLEPVSRSFLYNAADVTGLYIFDNRGKMYYEDPGKTNREVSAAVDYSKITESGWYEEAQDASGKELLFGEDVLEGSDLVISCVKVLNRLNSSDQIGLLVIQIDKDTMRNVIGQFPTDRDVYVLANNGKIVYENGYRQDVFGKELSDVLQNSDGRYLITEHACTLSDWELLHAVRKDAVFGEAGRFRMIILIVACLAVVLTVFLCIWQARAVTRPLEQLKEDIERVGKGKRTFHNSYGTDEVGTIGKEFQQMVTRQLRLQEQVSQEELLRKDSELQLLQSQINPHFLYNTLDTLYWMAIEDGADQVADLTQSLSEIFKISLSGGSEFIPVKDEIRFIEDYLHIQNVRFGDKFIEKILVDDDVQEILIVKQILQPFVENAIYHGLEPKIEKGRITITGKIEGEMLIFTVADDGVGISEGVDVMSGYAVSNVYQRIRLHYGEEANLRFESVPGEGTTVFVILPLKEVLDASNRARG